MLRHAPALNRGHPLARGLVMLLVAGYPIDLVSGKPATIGADTQTVVGGRTKWGRAFETTSTAGAQYVSVPDLLVAAQITTRHTLIGHVDIDTIADYGHVVSMPWANGSWSSPYQPFKFGGDEAAAVADAFTAYVTGGIQQQVHFAGTFWQTGAHSYAWTRDGAAQIIYRDGVQFSTDSSKSASPIDFSGGGATTVVLQGNTNVPADAPGSWDGRQPFTAIWNRVLAPGEIVAVTADPECLFRPTGSPTDLLGLLGVSAGVTIAADSAGWIVN